MGDLSSSTRDQTYSPCVGRQSLNHWTTKEVPPKYIFKHWTINCLFADNLKLFVRNAVASPAWVERADWVSGRYPVEGPCSQGVSSLPYCPTSDTGLVVNLIWICISVPRFHNFRHFFFAHGLIRTLEGTLISLLECVCNIGIEWG